MSERVGGHSSEEADKTRYIKVYTPSDKATGY